MSVRVNPKCLDLNQHLLSILESTIHAIIGQHVEGTWCSRWSLKSTWMIAEGSRGLTSGKKICKVVRFSVL